MNFETAVNIVLMHEGGAAITNDPNDPGGLTRYGISKRSFPNLDIANLTLPQAKELYRRYYWDMCECDNLPNWARLIVFDCAVNQGVTRAIIFIQRVVMVPADGILGEQTMLALKQVSPDEFIGSYAKHRFKAYKANPNWRHYGGGWSDRLLDMVCLSFSSVIRGFQVGKLLT